MQELRLIDRTTMVAKTYAAIQLYFAHWQDASHDFDLEDEFPALMELALETPDRFEFGLAMMRFISRLNNSHSWYRDPEMFETAPNQAYKLKYWHDEWVVVASYVDALQPGDVVTHIDHRSMQDWFDKIRPVMNASSTSIAIEKLSQYLVLFIPERYEVALSDGRTVTVDHATAVPPKPVAEQVTTGKWLEESDVGYIHIPSFNQEHFEERALEFVEHFKDAESIIFDLRDCRGGNSPRQLVEALMTVPYRFWMEGTPLHLGLLKYRIEQFGDIDDLDDYMKGYIGAIKYFFNHSMMVWEAPLIQPENPVFSGKVFLLVGSTVASAAEDFVVPFKTSGRGTLIGQQTYGSTGQPYHMQFETGITISIGTKRAYFPDGARYEGVGIAPDIEIIPTSDDLRAGRDPVLEKAIELSQKDG
jgi:carboxyl-terminal processing protease